MKSYDLTNCTHLMDFAFQIKMKHLNDYGESYVAHYEYLEELSQGASVVEFGINQGASLANILVNGNPSSLIGVDKNLKYIEPYRHLFEDFAKTARTRPIDFELREMSTSKEGAFGECDVLHIDSLHKPDHLKKELARYGHRVRKAIVFHDTNAPKLLSVISSFVVDQKDWFIDKHSHHGVGFTVIRREKRIPKT